MTCRLSLRVKRVDVHGEMQFVSDHLLVLASKLVCAVDALGVPVCPVQIILKHCDGKRMRKTWQRQDDDEQMKEEIQSFHLENMDILKQG